MSKGSLRAAIAAVVLCACGKSAPRVENPPPPVEGPPPAGSPSPAASPPRQNVTVTVTVLGDGAVSVSGQAQPCVATCSYDVPVGSQLDLYARPAMRGAFSSWGGACSGAGGWRELGSCTRYPDRDLAVSATFSAPTRPAWTLTIDIQGKGTGKVSVTDAVSGGTECSGHCAVEVSAGLTRAYASPAKGSKLRGWSGACAGVGQCVFDVSGNASLTMVFDPIPPPPWRYDWIDVTKLDGLDVSPAAIDESGALAGTYLDGPERGVFLWDGTLRRMPLPPGARAQVSAASGGVVVGTIWPGATHDNPRAFMASDGVIRELDSGTADSEAFAVNAEGLAVGKASDDGNVRAVAWRGGVMHDLGKLPGETESRALAVDDGGRAYGVSCSRDASYRFYRCVAVRFGGAGPVSLGELPYNLVSMSSTGSAVLWDSSVGAYTAQLIWSGGQVLDVAELAAHYALRGSPGWLSIATQGPNVAGDAAVTLWAPISEAAAATIALLHDGEMYDISEVADLGGPPEWPALFRRVVAFNDNGQMLIAAGGGPSPVYRLLTPHPQR